MIKFIFTLILLTSAINFVNAQIDLVGFGKIYPNDESAYDQSFSQFYSELKNAVNNRYANFVEDIIAATIQIDKNDFTKNNIGYFKRRYDLNDTASEFWRVAKKVLSLGAVRMKHGDTGVFVSPSIYFSDVYEKIFGEEYYLEFEPGEIVGCAVSDSALVYFGPLENNFIIGKLNHEIVKIKNFERDKYVPWYKIELKDGKTGWVKNEDIYLALFDYILSFKRVLGQWHLVGFERTRI